MKINKGEIITLSEGEYSDYCVNGVFKVLKDFDTEDVKQLLAIHHGAESFEQLIDIDWQHDKKMWMFEPRKAYIGYLNSNGYIEDVDYREIHLGSYGDLNINLGDK